MIRRNQTGGDAVGFPLERQRRGARPVQVSVIAFGHTELLHNLKDGLTAQIPENGGIVQKYDGRSLCLLQGGPKPPHLAI